MTAWVVPWVGAWAAPPAAGPSCPAAPAPVPACDAPGVLCVDDDGGPGIDYTEIFLAEPFVQPGDVVVVKPGTYSGSVFNRSGTPQAPITWVADGEVHVEFLAVSASHLRFRGFVIDTSAVCVLAEGFNDDPLTDLELVGLTCRNPARHGFALDYVEGALIEGNHIEGYGAQLDGDGLFLTATHDLRVACNTVGPGGPFSGAGLHVHVASGLEVERNVVWEATLDGMDLDGVVGSTFRDNLLYDNGRHGIRGVQEVALEPPADLVFVSNTIVAGDSAIVMLADQGGHTVFGNVLVGRAGYALAVKSNDLQSDYNVLAGAVSLSGGEDADPIEEWRSRGLDERSVYRPDGELFVDPVGGDYRPTPASGAIDLAPVTYGQITVSPTDLVGNPRPIGAGVDAGALETDAGCAPAVGPDPCNGVDDDCDGSVDEDPVAIDADADGYGGEPVPCDPLGPPLAVALGDCDDTDGGIHPGALEVAGDRLDQDCDGLDLALGLSGGTCGQAPRGAGIGSVVLAVATVGWRRRGRRRP